MALIFGNVLQDFYKRKKTGSLFAVVNRNTEHTVRFYFVKGEIHHLSFGTLRGNECLERLNSYDFGMAVFCNGLRPPRSFLSDLPETEKVIEAVKSMKKTIRGIRFAERGRNPTYN